jgi:hypothetical protein
VGYTELILECAPDGLASRSKGIISQNDFLWALRVGVKMLLASVGRVGQFARLVLWRVLRRWKMIILIGGGALYFFVPEFRTLAHRWFDWGIAWARYLFARVMG